METNKEEDLGMNQIKEVKSIDDLEVGIFVCWLTDGDSYIIIDKNSGGMFSVLNIASGNIFEDQKLSGVKFWSYTYTGNYNQIIVEETPQQKKLKELQETAKKIEQQIKDLIEVS